MACYPWVVPHQRQQQNLEQFPNLQQWFERMAARAAVIRAYERAQPWSNQPTITEESKKILFGQTASSTGNL